MELYEQVKREDWSFAVNGIGVPTTVWRFEKHYQSIGAMGGGGLGYGPPAAVGAALANRKHGRLTVAVLGDGDMMYTSSALWTAAHHRIPLLAVMHNNRAYHQEMMHMQRMGNRRNRGIDRAHIGCEITDPNIDFAKLAQSLGCYAEGPIDNPNDLGPAIKRAVAVVKKGEPALIDVVTQPR
jgi:thiamine pyrophosphate-dependent acetolactate synthase large subunit-like protein